MRISVIMTVKNGERFIMESLGSVIEQSHPPFEVVVVDDGSTDNTLKILNDLRDGFSFLKIVETSGVGRAKALNLAVEHSTGDWIANIDSDDQWHPDKLWLQIQSIGNNDDVDILATETVVIYGENIPKFKKVGVGDLVFLPPYSFFSGNKINHSSVLIRRELFDFIGGYNCQLKKQIDLDLWLRALNNNKKIYKIDLPLTCKRIHSKQSFERKNRYRYAINSFLMKIKFLHNNDAPKIYYLYNFLKLIYHFLPVFMKNTIRKGVHHCSLLSHSFR